MHDVKNTSVSVSTSGSPPPPPPVGQTPTEGASDSTEDVDDRERTVAVRGLHPSTSKETVELYFENKRSGGGPVDDVTMDAEKGVAYVTFEKTEGETGNRLLPLLLSFAFRRGHLSQW